MNIYCPNCENECSEAAQACPKCGHPLAGPPTSPPIARPSPATLARPVVHATRRVIPASRAPSSPKRRKHRLWLALLLIAAVFAAPFAPMLPLWFGIVLLLLCVATFVPRVQGLSRRLLRLNPSEKWRSTIRLTTYALIGLVLILAGATVAGREAEQNRIATLQAAEEAEQQRLADEANARVVAVARKAERAWRDGLWALAEKKFEEASRVPNATEFAAIGQLRNGMANAKVDALLAKATEALKAGDIDAGSKKVQAALAVPHADDLADARRVEQQIRNATDPDCVGALLMKLPDEVFQQLEGDGTIPKSLLSGYEVLDARAADVALAQIGQVAAARDKQRQEEQRLAAEAARRAEERRIAEAKQRQEEQRLAAEAARRAEERRIAEAKQRQEEQRLAAEAEKREREETIARVSARLAIKETYRDPKIIDVQATLVDDEYYWVNVEFEGINALKQRLVSEVKTVFVWKDSEEDGWTWSFEPKPPKW